jgi:hypothetical protein
VLYSLVFTAVTLIVFRGTKDPFAEKAVSFGFKSSVIDGLWLLDLKKDVSVADLSSRPFLDLIRRSYLNPYFVELIYFSRVAHSLILSGEAI